MVNGLKAFQYFTGSRNRMALVGYYILKANNQTMQNTRFASGYFSIHLARTL